MGKGDKKTRRGKIFMGSFGVKRPRNKKVNPVIVSKTKEVITPAKKEVKEPEVVEQIIAVPEVTEVADVNITEKPKEKTKKETVKKDKIKEEKEEKTEKPKKEKTDTKEKTAKKPTSKNKKEE